MKLSLRLDRSDGDDVHDILNGAAAGQVVDRLGKTLDDRADGLRVAQTLHQLVADVARLQIREDQHVRLAGNRAARALQFADGGNERGIRLHLAVHVQLRRLLMHQLHGVGNLVHVLMLRRALRGEGEQRNLRVDAEELCRAGGLDGHFRQLLGCGEGHGAGRLVNGEVLMNSDYEPVRENYLTSYAALGYDIQDETVSAYLDDLALTAAIQNLLVEQDMRAQGCYDFDEETENWCAEQGQSAYESALAQVAETLNETLELEDADETLQKYALQYAELLGVTAQDYIDVYRTQYATMRYYAWLTQDCPVTEEEIQAEYERQKAQYEQDMARYRQEKAAYDAQMAQQSQQNTAETTSVRRRRAPQRPMTYSDYVSGETVENLPDPPRWPQVQQAAEQTRTAAEKSAKTKKQGGLMGRMAKLIEEEDENDVSGIASLPPRVDVHDAYRPAKTPQKTRKR